MSRESLVFITPLTSDELMELKSVREYKERKRLLKTMRDKPGTQEFDLPSHRFDFEDDWIITGKEFTSDGSKRYFAFPTIHRELDQFDLSEDIKRHIAKGLPIFITQWY